MLALRGSLGRQAKSLVSRGFSAASSMRAVEITVPGPADVLALTERPVPRPAPGEVLVQVAVAGVNRPDVVQRLGLYPAPKGVTDIPGLEIAGKVVAAGDGVDDSVLGTDVCALVAGGGYAEYCTADAQLCLPIPRGCSLAQAAALPETAFTVFYNLFMRGGLHEGKRVLIHGGTSGIGSMAIQLATAKGVEVLTTAGSDEKCGVCLQLGATHAINYRSDDFVQLAKSLGGVDLVLDMVGGEYLQRNVDCLREEGTLCTIGFLGKGGPKGSLNLTRVMLKKLKLTGSTLRSQSLQAKSLIAQGVREEVWPLVEAGKLSPLLDQSNILPLPDAAEAHRRMESGSLVGKVMLCTPYGFDV